MKTGVSLPEETYRSLLTVAKALGYASVSKAIRDAAELFIAFNRWWTHRGRVAGIVQVVARRDLVGLLGRLYAVEAEFKDIVLFSTSVGVGEKLLFHILFVEGEGRRVKELYRALTRIDGLLAIQPALLPHRDA